MSTKIKAKSFTRQDITKTAETVMDIIKSNLDGAMDIADLVINECSHRITMEKKLRFCNPGN